MKKLILKSLFFLIPAVFYSASVFVIDPFGKFNVSHVIDEKVKLDYAFYLNSALWKIIRYNRNPQENVIISDSRLAGMDIGYIEQKTNMPFSDLTLPGGTLGEIISCFYHTVAVKKPSRVYIGINFLLYGRYESHNRIPGAVAAASNSLLYLSNYNTLEGSYKCLMASLNGQDSSLKDISPRRTAEERWNDLEKTNLRYFLDYKYPDYYFEELRLISEFCSEYDVKLVFIIPPSHVELLNLIKSNNLGEAEERFKSDIRSFADTYDFDFDNSFTRNKSNFFDPYHLNDKTYLADIFSDIVLGDTASVSPICRISKLNDRSD